MKIILFLIGGALAFAADKPKPLPIPAAQQEKISRAMLSLQAAQLKLKDAQAEAEKDGQIYLQMLDKLRKEFNAEGCDLMIDKIWQCPTSTSEVKK